MLEKILLGLVAALASVAAFFFSRANTLKSQRDLEKLKNQDIEGEVKTKEADSRIEQSKKALGNLPKPEDKELTPEEVEEYWRKK